VLGNWKDVLLRVIFLHLGDDDVPSADVMIPSRSFNDTYPEVFRLSIVIATVCNTPPRGPPPFRSNYTQVVFVNKINGKNALWVISSTLPCPAPCCSFLQNICNFFIFFPWRNKERKRFNKQGCTSSVHSWHQCTKETWGRLENLEQPRGCRAQDQRWSRNWTCIRNRFWWPKWDRKSSCRSVLVPLWFC